MVKPAVPAVEPRLGILPAIAAGAASGVLAGASFTPIGAWPIAWVGLAPWFVALGRTGVRGAAASGFVFGAVYFALAMGWLRHPTWAAAAGLGLYHGLFYGAIGPVLRRVARSTGAAAPILLACAWVGVDLLLARLFSGIPWLLFGYTQAPWIALIQIADVTGVYGVGFLLALSGAALAAWASPGWRPRTLGAIALGGALCTALVYGTGERARERPAKPGPRIAGIQPNIPQSLKNAPAAAGGEGVFEKNHRLTLAALRIEPRADLLIWAETMNPYHNLGAPDVPRFRRGAEEFGQIARDGYRIPWLLGTPYYLAAPDGETWPPYTNAAILFRADGTIAGRFDKLHPIPWGEYVPLGLGFIADFLEGFAGFPLRMVAGEDPVVFELDEGRFGALVCFDVIYPRYARQMVRGGAQFLVNLTNEAWFLESAEFDQLLAQSVFRAVENRVDVVRVTNSGISAHIGPDGVVLAKVEAGGRDRAVEGVLRCRPALREPTTVYTRVGDRFAAVVAGVAAIGLAAATIRARRRKSRHKG